jgi:hypothetical protein
MWATVEMKIESNTMNWWDEFSLSSLWVHLIYCLERSKQEFQISVAK